MHDFKFIISFLRKHYYNDESVNYPQNKTAFCDSGKFGRTGHENTLSLSHLLDLHCTD